MPLSGDEWLKACEQMLYEKFILSDAAKKELNGVSDSKYHGHGKIAQSIEIISKKRTEKLEKILKKFKPW